MDPEPTPIPDDFPEWHEPFPEPQTIPAGWDLSGTTPNTEPDPFDTDDSTAED